ncbi:MAG: fumarylacetoacetate hydrolase family protein [Rhodocyclaceae bacterium]
MRYAFEPAPRPALPVAGIEEFFPVRRIYCVGRNYAEHAREMGADPEREPPFFFCKSAHALVPGGGAVAYPPMTNDYQHEVELVVAIGSGGADIARERAAQHVFGYAVGLDMTRRDLQAALKAKGRPWEMGKSFDASAPVGAIRRVADCAHPGRGAIRLEVDGVERQRGDVSDMIWSVDEVIAQLSRLVRLEAGDLVFTGTPAGVGALARGQSARAAIEGVGELEVRIV